MDPVRKWRLEALILPLLKEPRSLEELHSALGLLYPGLRKATLFALLVRLKRQGKVLYQEGRFLARESAEPDP
nr:hypothetical protein [Thermus thalpophilus]